MIPAELRRRIENFISEHEEEGDCLDDVCALSQAREWVEDVKASGYPEKELLLMALAYFSYVAHREEAEEELAPYHTGLAALIARNGGVLKVSREEIRSLVGSMTMTTDPDGVTYHLIEQARIARS